MGARVRLVAAIKSCGLELLGVAALWPPLPPELCVGELFSELWLERFDEPRKRRLGGLRMASSSEAVANAVGSA